MIAHTKTESLAQLVDELAKTIRTGDISKVGKELADIAEWVAIEIKNQDMDLRETMGFGYPTARGNQIKIGFLLQSKGGNYND